ncbi:MAG: MotA/TolQ/ExbB proton channel family protein [Planctomycetota bacterium]|nr:MotA/TolQ/ExbB proton channel family protein [Planctomycetota bacterium]
MSKSGRFHSAFAVIQSLGWPILLGSAAYTAFMLLLTRQVISSELLDRYLTSHPVSYIATAMFFIGVASLLLKTFRITREYMALRHLTLEAEVEVDGFAANAELMKERWESLGESIRAEGHYLFERVRTALGMIERRGSSEGMEDELKYLAELDSERSHQSYALVRILIWATPMLGFLGTVIGISEAWGGLNIGGAADFDSMMQGLRSSLYVAFDTTALALTLSIGLMFFQFIVDRFEQNLLTQVESQSNEDLLTYFQASSPANDPISRAIERSGKSVLDAVHSLVERQSQLWESALVNAQSQWNNAAIQTASTVHTEFENAVRQSLLEWRKSHLAISEDAEQRWHNRWEQLQIALTDNARQMHAQQSELVRHTEVLNKAVAATAEVLKLEDALNRNLQTLSSAGHFEEAVMSLSATIHLLNNRLNQNSTCDRVDLKPKGQEKAA